MRFSRPTARGNRIRRPGLEILDDRCLLSALVALTEGPYVGTWHQGVDIQGSAVGGVGPYAYSWDMGSYVSAVNGRTSPEYQVPLDGFTYYADPMVDPETLTLTVTDSTGATASATTTFTEPLPGPPKSVAPPQPPTIVTAFDTIPNFGAVPTVTSVASGPWSDPATWSTGTLPAAGAVVDIAGGTTVTFDLNASPTYKTVAVDSGGELDFRTTASSTLNVGNLEVLPGGTFQIGTLGDPLPSAVTAQVVFADQPIDTAVDPSSYGTGLVDLGTVNLEGAAKSPYATLGTEARAGATTITLAIPATCWTTGDRLVFPDTRQLTFEEWQSYSPQWESATIASVSADGRTVTLAAPLQFDHLGARDLAGTLRYLPQVQDLTRNVILTSANPAGTRGHAMFTGSPTVDIRNVAFTNLGRTTNDPIDSTTYNADGSVAHLGTNQIGRYPLHIHHAGAGSSFTLIGNAIDEGDGPNNVKWGITVHGSSGGLIQGNDVYNVQGSGIITEDGTESNNTFDANMVVRVGGNGARADNDLGTQGFGFWFSGPSNIVTNNIVADIHPAGDANGGVAYEIFCENGQNDKPINVFSGNTAYGATNKGLEIWYLGNIGSTIQPVGPSLVQNTTLWHLNKSGWTGYPVNNLTVDGFTFLDDLATSDRNESFGIDYGDYLANNLTITNADIEGAITGIRPSTDMQGTTNLISNSYLANRIDVKMVTLWTSGARGDTISPRKVVLQDDVFDTVRVQGSTAISMAYEANGSSSNLIQNDQLFVTNYNRVLGDNFQIFYNEQAASFIVPQTIYGGNPPYVVQLGSPVAGLTNAQTWAQYGIAIGGAVAPATGTTRPGIVGLVNSTSPPQALAPAALGVSLLSTTAPTPDPVPAPTVLVPFSRRVDRPRPTPFLVSDPSMHCIS